MIFDQVIDFVAKSGIFPTRNMLIDHLSAGVTQLVEYELPKLGVAGSNPVARSIEIKPFGVAIANRHSALVFETKIPNQRLGIFFGDCGIKGLL